MDEVIGDRLIRYRGRDEFPYSMVVLTLMEFEVGRVGDLKIGKRSELRKKEFSGRRVLTVRPEFLWRIRH